MTSMNAKMSRFRTSTTNGETRKGMMGVGVRIKYMDSPTKSLFLMAWIMEVKLVRRVSLRIWRTAKKYNESLILDLSGRAYQTRQLSLETANMQQWRTYK